jgi:hypothetical protein
MAVTSSVSLAESPPEAVPATPYHCQALHWRATCTNTEDNEYHLTYSVSSPSPPSQEYPEALQTGQHRHHMGAAFCNSVLV